MYMAPDKLPSPKFVARSAELKKLMRYLSAMCKGRGTTAFISGEAGVGKTELVNKLSSYAISKDIRVLKGVYTSHLQHPFQPFINALKELTTEKIIYEEEEENFTLIEELFLVNNFGVPMAHVSQKGRTLGEQIIGSMLSAVQDFVKDSFGDKSKVSALDRLDYGSKKILIEHGEYVFIACVVEGELHPDLRTDLKTAVAHIEKTYRNIVSAWDGTLSKVEDIKKYLVALSLKKYPIRKPLEGEKLEAKRIQLYENVTQLIIKHLQKPMLLLIEDIHWAEEVGLLMLQYISRNTKNSKLLICCTYRSEEISPRVSKILAKMKENGEAEELFLKPLVKDDITTLIKSLFHASQFSEPFFNDIYEKSGGNPFYAKELIHTLTAEGVIQNIDGKWQINPAIKLRLPATVIEAFSRRLDKLNAEEIRIVECAATIGTDIPLDLLSACLDIDKNKIISAFTNIENYKILHLHDKKSMTYQFEHAITREVIYAGMSERWRKLIHQQVGTTLEKIYKDNIEEVVYQLAHHFYRDGAVEKAVNYTTKAGEKAKREYAVERAVEYYKNALDTLSATGGIETQKKTIEILRSIGELSRYIGKWAESLGYYDQLITLSEALNEKRMSSEAYRNIGEIYIGQAKYEASNENLKKALSISESINDEYGIASSYYHLGTILWRTGKLDDANTHLTKCLKIAEKINSKSLLCKTLLVAGAVHWSWGKYRDALEYHRKSLGIAEELDDKYEIVRAYNNIGAVYSEGFGNYAKAIEWYEKQIKLSRKIGYIRSVGYGLSNVAESYAKLSQQLDKAKEYTDEALNIFSKLGEKRMIGVCLYNYGVVYYKKKEWNKSEECFEKAVKIAEEVDCLEGLSQYYHDYARMLADKGNKKKAMGMYQKSIAVYKKLGNKQKHEEVKKEMERIR